MRTAGMMLIELMAALVLMAAFSLIAAELFDAVLRTTARATDVPPTDRPRRALIERMREDAWGASDLRVVGGNELVLRFAGDRSVFWKIDAGPVLRRTELLGVKELSRQQWGGSDATLPTRFDRFGPGVRMTWPPAAGADQGIVDLYSRVNLAGGQP